MATLDQIQRGPDEFGIEIRFAPNSDAPSRVFRSMVALIECFQEIDAFLVGSIATGLKPSTLLEDIETGSLRTWLKNVLESVDDETLKSGDWKKIVGIYLVKAKRIMVNWSQKRTTVDSPADIEDLRQLLLNEASRTDVLKIPTYSPIPSTEVVRSIELISDALKPLGETDSVIYLSGEAPVEFNRSFDVSPDALTDLLVKEAIRGEDEMILVIKRPDFLGDSQWEFRWDKRAFEARIEDAEWVGNFRNGMVPLQPGDALRCIVKSIIRYGYDGEVVDKSYEIIQVVGVIHTLRPSQGNLFRLGPPEAP